MNSLLLVEDDQSLSASLSKFLESEGYTVTVVPSLAHARERIASHRDLVVLDWMLPDGQGVDLVRELRRVDNPVPIILLTSRSELVDKIVGLEIGANDYITKPFEPRELAARIRVQLRSSSQKISQPEASGKADLVCGPILLKSVTREVFFKGALVELTKMEFDLLHLLMQNPNRVFPREAILNKVWGYENYPTTRTVDNHIVQLRQKLDPEMFETVRGVGYRFREKR
jgi:DNA-binding response OmpR family regulator